MEIPLTSFIDFVIKSGSPKMTCAQKIKSQMGMPYDPVTDYYKRFREAVQELHQKNLSKSKLSHIIGALPDTKVVNYNAMIEGYKKFLGTKTVTWFDPPRKVWKHGDIEIPINPEVGIEWGGKKHIIKLYLKAEKPSKDRAASVLALMNKNLGTINCEYCLLDVRNSKSYFFEKSMTSLIPLVEGEAVALKFLLDRI